jgi:hypothetical protein
METVLNRLGPPVPANENRCTESEDLSRIDSPEVGICKLELQAAAAASAAGPTEIGMRSTAAKCKNRCSSDYCYSSSGREQQENVTGHETSLLNVPPLHISLSVDPLPASAPTPSIDMVGEERHEVKQAQHVSMLEPLGSKVGDLTHSCSNFDYDKSRGCCWWPHCCFSQPPDDYLNVMPRLVNESEAENKLPTLNRPVVLPKDSQGFESCNKDDAGKFEKKRENC